MIGLGINKVSINFGINKFMIGFGINKDDTIKYENS